MVYICISNRSGSSPIRSIESLFENSQSDGAKRSKISTNRYLPISLNLCVGKNKNSKEDMSTFRWLKKIA